MRRLTLLAFVVLACVQSVTYAQQRVVHRNIGIDSLISLFRSVSSEPVYYLPSASANNLTFTINGSSANLVEDIKTALVGEGYAISYFHNSIFVLKGAGLTAMLPIDYFKNDVAVEERAQQDYIDALQSDANVATSQNKVYQIGDKEKILEFDIKRYALFCEALGENHLETIKMLHEVANSYLQLGNKEKALEQFEKSYEICYKILGEEDFYTIVSLNSAAYVCFNLGKKEEALKLYQKLQPVCNRILGEDHKITIGVNKAVDVIPKMLAAE